MKIGLEKVFDIHADAMIYRSKRSALLASNLANADTPNYKAKDIDFKEVFDKAQINSRIKLTTSNTSHIPLHNNLNTIHTKFRIPEHPALDGNTVDTQIEKSLFAENAVRYQISMHFLNGNIKGIINALRVDA